MSVTEWIGVPDNPMQRPTEERASRARHLDKFTPKHALVEMALLPDGSRFKIDGHTRAYRWSLGDVVDAPEQVLVHVWGCRDLDAVKALYNQTDSQVSVETTQDRIGGAERAAGIVLTSSLLKTHKYANAIRFLYSTIFGEPRGGYKTASAMATVIEAFKRELMLLDSVNPTKARFVTGTVEGALATFIADGPAALPFWEAYANNQGRRNTQSMDGVQALSEAFASETKRKGRDCDDHLFRKSISAYQAWRRNQTYSVNRGSSLKGLSSEAAREFCREAYRNRSMI